jgi:hypothetical protein
MILVKILIKLIQSFKSSQYSHVSSPQVLKYDISFGSQFLKSTVCMSQLLFCGSEILCSSEVKCYTVIFRDINVIGIEPLMVTPSCLVMRKVTLML